MSRQVYVQKIYVHKNQIELLKRQGFGKNITDLQVKLQPTSGYVECDIQFPDRLTTITESQFDKAIKDEGNFLENMPGVVGRIKNALFGD